MELSICATEADRPDVDDERELIERAKHDRQAFAVLYRSHRDAVTRYVFRRTGDVHATEDVVAEVFLAVVRSLRRYRYRGIPFRAWLYRIATREVNRWAKRRRRDAGRALHDRIGGAGPSVPQVADGMVHAELARLALLSLPPKQQAALALFYLEGLTIDEVATVTGWRAGTVKSRPSRARRALREKLSARR